MAPLPAKAGTVVEAAKHKDPSNEMLNYASRRIAAADNQEKERIFHDEKDTCIPFDAHVAGALRLYQHKRPRTDR